MVPKYPTDSNYWAHFRSGTYFGSKLIKQTRTKNYHFVESPPISYLLFCLMCVSKAFDVLGVPFLLTAVIPMTPSGRG